MAPAAAAGRSPVSVAGTLLRSSAASQSPAHSLVPLTVPTNLHPGEPFGFICTNGLLPTLGGAVWANAVAEKPIAARTSKTLIVNFPFACEYTPAKDLPHPNQYARNTLS